MNKADCTAFLRRNGQQIDLGGIAKGYAADEAVRILKKYKVHNALINFGGTVVVLVKEQKIGIQNPFQKSGVSMVDIAEETPLASGSTALEDMEEAGEAALEGAGEDRTEGGND